MRTLTLLLLAGCGGGLAPDVPLTGSQVNCPGPGCAEVCDDGVDNDEDGYADCNDLDCDSVCDFDADDDGHDAIGSGGNDCDDSDPAVHPGATEVCDGIDNDCDGDVDLDDADLDPADVPEWWIDADGDGYGTPGNSVTSCDPLSGAATNADDCNDSDPAVHPGAVEVPGDCRDDNCDGITGDAGCAEFLYTVRTSDGMLRRLDPVSLVFTDIGPLGVSFSFGEVAYDAATGVMWMVDGRGPEALHTVDLNTGAATQVGVHGITDLFGLAVAPNGTIYGSGESPTGLYTMDAANGTASLVGDPFLAADGLAYDTTRNTLVGLAAGGGDLHAIDPATGASTPLANQGFINNCGLAYDADRDLYWAIDYSGYLYTYDPNNGYLRTEVMSGLGAHDGLTFGP